MESYKILPALRKGRVLTSAQFGCLKNIPTLNITQGCLFQCTYCYARGYSQAPERGQINLYSNLPGLLKTELSRKRTIPPWIILNTASDCFQTHPDILQVTYEVIQILFDHGIGISFLTKGIIPRRLIDLFGRKPEKTLAQIGMVCLSKGYWKSYEPQTPSPEDRIENIRRLKEAGISTEVRIDPIIPFVTDTEKEVTALFHRLKEWDIRRVTLSYLHLRPAIERQLKEELPPLQRKLMESCFSTREWEVVGSSTKTKLLPQSIREKGYERIKKIAGEFGINALICQCKNPDLKGDLCGSSRTRARLLERRQVQLPLFRC